MQLRCDHSAMSAVFDSSVFACFSPGCNQENCGGQNENGKREKGEGEAGIDIIKPEICFGQIQKIDPLCSPKPSDILRE